MQDAEGGADRSSEPCLRRNTTYHFQIVATNPTGTSEGGDQTFTTANPPEFGRCVKVAKGVKGKFSTAVCTAPATEKAFAFECEPGPGPKAKFTTRIKPEAVATFETVTKKLVVCKGETSTGEYRGVKTVGNVVCTFTGCEMGGIKCLSSGAEEGQVMTKTLEGALGVEKTSLEGDVKNKIATDLIPAGESGALAEFSCGATAVTIRGSVLNPVSRNKMVLTVTVKWNATVSKQKPENSKACPRTRSKAHSAKRHSNSPQSNSRRFRRARKRSRSTQSSEQPVTRSP